MKISFATQTILSACAFLLVISLGQPAFCQFDQIFNIPPDPVPSVVPSNSQLNLFDKGVLPDEYEVVGGGGSPNIEINIFGGQVGNDVFFNSRTSLNISGGEFGERFETVHDQLLSQVERLLMNSAFVNSIRLRTLFLVILDCYAERALE